MPAAAAAAAERSLHVAADAHGVADDVAAAVVIVVGRPRN